MKSVRSRPAADDVIEALLAYFPANQPEFTTSAEKIHIAFYDLKKKFPALFADFVFDPDKSFPYSRDVEFTLTCLAGCALISTQNPYLEKFLVTEALAKHYKKVTRSKLSDVPPKRLKEISKELQAALKC